MLRWMILVVAVVFLTAGATLVIQFLPDSETASKVPVVEAPPTGPQPEIVIEGDLTYDFGKMAKNDEASHSWVVKNVGQAPLEIWLDGKTTCSCTVSKPGEKETLVIQPGQSDTIDLHWHTKKDLPEDYGQGGTFGTNDYRKKSFMLTAKGKVYPAVVIYPPQMLQFGTFSNEVPRHTTFAVYSKERPDVKVTKIVSSKPDLIVGEAKPMTREQAAPLKVEKGYIVTVTVKPGMPLGTFHEQLMVQTDHPKMPKLDISMGGTTYGPISVSPERIRVTDVKSSDGLEKDVTLVVSSGKETHFDVAEKPDKLDVTIVPDNNVKGRYHMKVKVPRGTASGEVEGNIVLKTDHSHASELKIPVTIYISGGPKSG
jgi:hypothetical protein